MVTNLFKYDHDLVTNLSEYGLVSIVTKLAKYDHDLVTNLSKYGLVSIVTKLAKYDHDLVTNLSKYGLRHVEFSALLQHPDGLLGSQHVPHLLTGALYLRKPLFI